MAEVKAVSEEDLEQAEKTKNEANEFFKAEKYDQAIELYSKVCNA